jgi:hypothetical protein
MQVEISAMIEDYDILAYVSEYKQAEVLEHIFDECTKSSQQKFISELDDSYLVEELKSRGYTITKNK